MISYRYISAVCALLALALVPTLIHSYSEPVIADGRHTRMIPDVLDGTASVPTDRSATWGKRRFDSDDWFERTYSNPETGKRLRLTVVRSLDAKSVYHHPELAVSDGTTFVGAETQRFEGRPEVPVHVLKPAPGVSSHALYALHYDDRFVEDPITFQLRTAGELLFSRRQPMTLFFVFDAHSPDGDIKAAAQLLFAAVDSFLTK